MKLNATYKKYVINGGGFAVPAFFNLLPIFAHINTFAYISSGEVFLFYLPLARDDQHDDVFQLGGIARDRLRDFCPQICRAGFYETLSLTANFIIIIILCWGGYRVFTPPA